MPVLPSVAPLIIGHRGACAVAPENMMAAFREAIAAGADGIEFDVRLTRDGVPVIIHDNSLHRTAGLRHRIAELTWSELEHVDPSVPSLEQLFELFKTNNLGLYLEMKCDSPSEQQALAEACVRLIDEHSLKERVIIECFQLPALKILKQIDPEIKTVALFEPTFTNPSVFSDQRIIQQATDVGAAAIALHHRLARESLVQKARAAGLHVAVWTVDAPSWIERAQAIGIDALITNDPAALLQARR
jgi:glycerophosphoryl diester phosphodiesterase